LAGLRGLQSRVTELEDQLKIKDAELANLQPASIGDTLPTGSVGGAALGGALAGAAVAGVAGFVAGSNAEAGPEDGSVRDDLTKVWGIGPKINKLLNNSGIFTFGKLARTQVNTLDQFLDEAGPNYQLADTSITQTWPEQAAIAASGDWQALRTYQQRFRRGSRPDNLARIWGIGLKRSQMLHRRGINTFATLAKVQPADIVDVLENGSEQYGMDKEELYRLWTDQAALLAQGKSKAFSDMRREYQQRYTTHDRLQRLWGIGPKTANALKAEGIDTYAELAEADLDDLGEIADTARLRPGLDKRQLYEIWIKQAKLATDNKWAELEKVAAELEAKFGHNREDDLTQIWGIGPKIDKILRQNGIKNFAQLAATDAGKLGKILKQAGSRFSLSTSELQQSWTEQARLANEGRWEELEALQAKLSWSEGTSS
jgi:predicted flap endonuclease-1-like 5' DNA nuclease